MTRRKLGLGATGLAASLLATIAWTATDARAADVPACVDEPNAGRTLAAQPRVPCDLTGVDADQARAEHYRFAWNTFFAITWPALSPEQQRGVPDTGKHFGAANTTPVWDTWKEKRELYRVVPDPNDSSKGVWSTADPGSFQSFPTTIDPNPEIQMCPGATRPDSRHVRALQNNKIDNFADEATEIDLTVLWKNGHSTPTEDGLVRYQVKFSKDYYDYVRSNQLYGHAQLEKVINDPSTSVDLPASTTGYDGEGTILLKTAWRLLDDHDDPNAYYNIDALYYDDLPYPATGKPDACYQSGRFGLIGIHVIRKTKNFPYFFFSTFEHVDNWPNAYLYANVVGGDGQYQAPPQNQPGANCMDLTIPVAANTPSSILPNGCGIAYTQPAQPQAGVGQGKGAYPADRLIPRTQALKDVNAQAQAVTDNTVWQNYRLVGIQSQPVDGKPYDPDPAADQDYYLANPVVETSQRFQFFTGSFSETQKQNVELNGGGTVMMGGCMGCHGAGSQMNGTDFSFTLNNVTEQPSGLSAAETLEEACTDIGLTIANGTCVASAD